jgi:hypothetical protein
MVISSYTYIVLLRLVTSDILSYAETPGVNEIQKNAAQAAFNDIFDYLMYLKNTGREISRSQLLSSIKNLGRSGKDKQPGYKEQLVHYATVIEYSLSDKSALKKRFGIA